MTRAIGIRSLVLRQLPSFLAALTIGEFAYRFHHFSLELGAFLATWFVLDGIVSGIRRILLEMRRGPATVSSRSS